MRDARCGEGSERELALSLSDGIVEKFEVGVAGLGGLALGAHHEHGLGVAGADQAPTLREFDAHAVDGVCLKFGGKVLCDKAGDAELDVFGAVTANFGSDVGLGDVGQKFA